MFLAYRFADIFETIYTAVVRFVYTVVVRFVFFIRFIFFVFMFVCDDVLVEYINVMVSLRTFENTGMCLVRCRMNIISTYPKIRGYIVIFCLVSTYPRI